MGRYIYHIILSLSLLLNVVCLFGQDDAIKIIPNEIGDNLSFVFLNNNPVKSKHLNAKTWVAKTFGDYKSVIQFEDDDNYKLILKGHSVLPDEVTEIPEMMSRLTANYTLTFTISIDSKDDRYRILFEDISVHSKADVFLFGKRQPDMSKETDRLVLDYCKDYEPDFASLDKDRDEIDSLKAMLSELPDKGNRQIEAQRKELRNKVETKQKALDRRVKDIEELVIENQNRKNAIESVFYGLVSSFKSTVERTDEF